MPVRTLAAGQPATRPSAGSTSWLVRGLLMALALLGVGGFLLTTWWQRTAPGDRLVAAETWLTQGTKPATITECSRLDRPELVWHVRFAHAPVGRRLWLACYWTDPQGRIAHQNHYQTQPLDSPDTATQAVFRLPPDAPPGTWLVRMSLAGQPLAQQAFQVQ
ncbi:MAG: hypothetical protein AB7O62_07025 [Pirellulales bacterium]